MIDGGLYSDKFEEREDCMFTLRICRLGYPMSDQSREQEVASDGKRELRHMKLGTKQEEVPPEEVA